MKHIHIPAGATIYNHEGEDGHSCAYIASRGNWYLLSEVPGWALDIQCDFEHPEPYETDEGAPQTDEQQSDGESDIQTPTMPPNAVLDFPEMGVRWPVPALVLTGIEGAIQQAQRQAYAMALYEAFNRVQGIHAPSQNPGEPYCVECGRRSEYPCDTLLAVMGTTREEQNMTEQPTNPDVPETMPEPTEPEVVPDEPAEFTVESKEGQTVQEFKQSGEGIE